MTERSNLNVGDKSTGGRWKRTTSGQTPPQAAPDTQPATRRSARRLPRGGACPRCDATTSQAVEHDCHVDAKTMRWLKGAGAAGSVLLLTTLTASTALFLAAGYWIVQRIRTKRKTVKPVKQRKEEELTALAQRRQQHPAAHGASAAVASEAHRLGVNGSVVVIEPQDHGVDVRARSVAGDRATVEMSDRAMMLAPQERSAMIARELAKVTPEGRRRERRIAAWRRARAPMAVVGSMSMAAASLPGLPMIAAGAGLWGACSVVRRRVERRQARRNDEVGYRTGGDAYLSALTRLAHSPPQEQ